MDGGGETYDRPSVVGASRVTCQGRAFHSMRGLTLDGMGTLFVSRIEALAKAGWAQRVFLFSVDGATNALMARIERSGAEVEVGSYRGGSRASLARAVVGCARRLRSFRPDVVHVWGAYPLIAARAALPLSRTPILGDWVTTAPRVDRVHGLALRTLPSLVVAVSDSAAAAAQDALQRISPARIVTLYPPFDAEGLVSMVDASPSPPVDTASLGFPLLGSVGRLVPEKGFDLLLRSLPNVRQTFPDVHLLLVGDGAEKGRLQDLVEELGLDGSVTLLGRIHDGARIFALVDVAVVPSREEGLGGYSALEAVSLGCPVVAARIDAIAEIFGPESGVRLADASVSEDLASAIIEVARLGVEEREQRTSAARRSVERTLGPGRFAIEHLAIVERARAQPRLSWLVSTVNTYRHAPSGVAW